VLEKNGGDDGTRTRGLCRDSLAGIDFTTAYKNAGTAKIPVRRTRHHELCVGLWVGDLPSLQPGRSVPSELGPLLNHAPGCDTRRMGSNKLAQVSGFSDQETEVGNAKIDT